MIRATSEDQERPHGIYLLNGGPLPQAWALDWAVQAVGPAVAFTGGHVSQKRGLTWGGGTSLRRWRVGWAGGSRPRVPTWERPEGRN